MGADEQELELIPRAVRDKLDRAGLKIHLREWQQLTIDERRRLRDQPCRSPAEITHYRAELTELVRQRTGKAPEAATTGSGPKRG